MNRIKVLHIRASNFLGGPEKQILYHLTRIDKRKFHPILCSYIRGGKENVFLRRAAELGIETFALEEKSPFDLGALMDLVSFIKEEKINLLCTHGYKPNVAGRLAGWAAKVPVVAVSRGWTSESLKIKTYEFLDKLFLRFSQHVVAVSEGQKRKLERAGIHSGKLSVIYNGIHVNGNCQSGDLIRREFNINKESVIVVSAGRLSREKNFEGLIEAAGLLKDMDVYFVVFGDGDLKGKLVAEIAKNKLQDRFFLPGFRSNLADYLSGADIFALSSHTEGLPNVILEAYALRKPVVGTRVGGVPELVQEKVTGFVVEPGDMKQFAECLRKLIKSATLREDMGRAGYDRVSEMFNIDQQTRRYEELFMRIVGSC